MKQTIKTIKAKFERLYNKVDRFFTITEPENLLWFIKAAPSEYDKDKALVNRMDYYEDYAKRY